MVGTKKFFRIFRGNYTSFKIQSNFNIVKLADALKNDRLAEKTQQDPISSARLQ